MNKNLIIHPYYFSRKKRIFDLCLAVIIGLISLPLAGIIYFAIYFSTGQPIFFKQKRWGQNKKAFTLFKFRTMIKNAESFKPLLKKINEAPRPMFKVKDDPRFVGIGKLLSRTALDELPQLLNVLKGEMSLVGPRPLPIKEAISLPQTWEYRFAVKPGLFSFWALSDQRFESSKRWQSLEQETLQGGGIGFDLKIIGQTFAKQVSKI